jgi:ERCC4-type nuclease
MEKRSVTIIYQDTRQTRLDKEYIDKYKIPIEKRVLESGDYIVETDDNKKFIFECKCPGDFLGSTKSGRLFEQLQKMALQDGYKPYIVITTDELYKDLMATRSKYADATFWGTVFSVMFSWNIPVIILSKNEFFGKILSRFSNGKKKSSHSASLHLNKYHRKTKDLVLLSLTCIPGIGSKTAENILSGFKCLHDIANSSIEELEKQAGLSEKQAKNVYEFFNRYF